MNEKWPRVRLSDVLRRSSEHIRISAEHEYREITVKLWGKGVVLRGAVSGIAMAGTHRHVARVGQLIVSRIDARNGAIGTVPPALDGAVVTNDFPLFDVSQSSLAPSYISWLCKTDRFVDLCRRASEGTTNRVRLQEDRFLALAIRLPPLSEQQRIVAQIEDFACRINTVQGLSKDIAAETDGLLLSAFKKTTAGVLRRKLNEVAPLVRRQVEVRVEDQYPELGIRSFGKGTFHKPAVDGLSLGTKRLYRIEPGDLLFSNVFAWEGAIAVAQPEDERRFGSHRFMTCVPKQGVATAEFLRYYFLTDEGLRKIGEASPGGAGRNRTLGLAKLANIDVPVPPIDKQLWFDRLQAKAREIFTIRADTTTTLDALMPSILARAFSGELWA